MGNAFHKEMHMIKLNSSLLFYKETQVKIICCLHLSHRGKPRWVGSTQNGLWGWEKRTLLPCCLAQYFCVISKNLSCRYITINAQRCSVQWAMFIAVWFAILKSWNRSTLLSEGNWLRSTLWNTMQLWKRKVDLYVFTDKKRWPEYFI